MGPGARRDRRPHPPGVRGGPPQRGDVPRRPPRRGRLHRSRAEGVERRRPQQPHQHLLVERPDRLPVVDGPRPPVVRLRQRRGDLPHLVAPRGRALLQPARPADHGGQGQGRDRDLRRSAAVEHRRQGRLLVGAVAGHRAGDAAGDRPPAHRARHVGARVRAALGQLGDVPRRGPTRPAAGVRVGRAGAARSLRRLHGRAGRARVRRRRRHAPHDRRDHRPPPDQAGVAHVARRRGRQPRRMAGGAVPVLPQRAHRLGGHRGRHQPATAGTSSSPIRSSPPPRSTAGTS